ncbi:hypothetical protein P3T76_015963 [Phytophthora citrophthora]|uniref:Uncharacterized protein n=1 Tax=Phytophthora citrophthora TaxID=4793 RepID=A0AAD9FYC8_9STRA|nr:hypothetical protein P3T76_015963 [Phytophthora citrophthora]
MNCVDIISAESSQFDWQRQSAAPVRVPPKDQTLICGLADVGQIALETSGSASLTNTKCNF